MGKESRNRSDGYTLHNSVRIVRGGEDYFGCIEEIASKATYSLHLQTYIFDEDSTGERVANALIAAAERGVWVYVMLDGYASQGLSKQFIERLKTAGIHFRYFEPFFRSSVYYFGRRLHHKVVVADGYLCLVGGVNISNRYNDMEGAPAWLDWAVMAEGDVAAQLDKVCVRVWNRGLFSKKCAATNLPVQSTVAEVCRVRVSRNDWVFSRTDITDSYRHVFGEAKKEITIMTSYFWPPQSILSRMEQAARSGVQVRVVLTGRADVPFVKYAERYLYNRLFRNNIAIYEYEKNILHGKMAILDRHWVTVGSYNLNNISAFASMELNLDVDDEEIANGLANVVEQIILEDCKQIKKDDFIAANSKLKMLAYYLSYWLVKATFLLFTFYFIQRRKRP
jgi:cardiolipin synthase